MKVSHLILSIVMCILTHPLVGQVHYLDTIYATGEANNWRPSLEQYEHTYFVANNQIDSIWKLSYYQIDTTGQILKSLEIVADSTELPVNCPYCFEIQGDYIYHAYTDFIATDLNDDTVYAKILKVKRDLSDTVETFSYSSQRHGLEIKDIVFDSDSTFIVTGITGSTDPNKIKYHVALAKFDTNFNVIWEKVVDDRDTSRIYGATPAKIVLDNYGTGLITGSDPYLIFHDEAYAIRFDVNTGDTLWKKTFLSQNPNGCKGMFAEDNGDGTYRFVWNRVTNHPQMAWQLVIGTMDTSGNILATKEIDWLNHRPISNDIIKTRDGNFYTSGQTYSAAGGRSYAHGLAFSPNLDSLWLRRFDYGQQPQKPWSSVVPFLQDSSGMLVHAGQFEEIKNGVFNRYLWLKVLDTDGCSDQNCGIGLPENVALDDRWVTYPNPSNGQFYIDHPELETFGNIQIEIVDVRGVAVFKENFSGDAPLNVRIESSGSYYISVTQRDGALVGVLPIVVQ